jgi:hypothetical protein
MNAKRSTRYFYPAVLTYKPEHEIAVTFPDLDVATSGSDEDNALLSARELLGLTLLGTRTGWRKHSCSHSPLAGQYGAKRANRPS